MRFIYLLLCACLFLFAGCCRVTKQLEPSLATAMHPKEIHREKRNFLALPQDFSISPFSPLTESEAKEDWGKEYRIALCFAQDFDLYRAITGFKRALCLLPEEKKEERELEIRYQIALAYYLGKKYVEAVFTVESSALLCVNENFPAYSDLLLLLYDSYEQLERKEHAACILVLIEGCNPENAHQLALLDALQKADFEALRKESASCEKHAYLDHILSGYERNAKSIKKAQFLNALLPGAGYWYVGLKQTAITAFLVNTLFIAAGSHFVANGNYAAGAIFFSLEGGWYFGGIYGAGLAAKSYNEKLYCDYASKITQREPIFPLLMLKYTF